MLPAVIYCVCTCTSGLFEKNLNSPHFKKERFALNFLTPQNASKFAIFMEKENPCSIFRFFILSNFHFSLMNALGH